MKKRVYLHFLALIIPAVISLALLLCAFYYAAFKNRETASVRESARLLADFLNSNPSDNLSGYKAGAAEPLRVTVIAPDGAVLLDNKAAAAGMENHAGRAEVTAALNNGIGEAERYSNTLAAGTYYYAVRLNDGNVLRVSKTLNSITGAFTAALPVVSLIAALMLALAVILARGLTERIIKPFNNIDLESENPLEYDELTPYIKKIERQKREISEQINALQSRADTIAAITDNMKEGLLLLDPTGAVLMANNSALRIFGENDMTRVNILHICRDMDFNRKIKECLRGVSAETDFARGGRVYRVYLNPVSNADGVNGGVILFMDITERRAADRQRAEFSANVSHELKTPLTTIAALAEILENGMAKEGDVSELAGKINAQSRRLIDLINDIIKLSEFDEGRIEKEFTEFDLCELARCAADTLKHRADEKHVTVSVAGGQINVRANRRMLDELLFNLIDNAIKYNRENGNISVSLAREGGVCKITVSDTGVGIPEEHLSRVFERFYRADKSRSKKTGGTGLGLSIVKHIAEYHGGKAVIESKEGEGTAVTITFDI